METFLFTNIPEYYSVVSTNGSFNKIRKNAAECRKYQTKQQRAIRDFEEEIEGSEWIRLDANKRVVVTKTIVDESACEFCKFSRIVNNGRLKFEMCHICQFLRNELNNSYGNHHIDRDHFLKDRADILNDIGIVERVKTFVPFVFDIDATSEVVSFQINNYKFVDDLAAYLLSPRSTIDTQKILIGLYWKIGN